MIAAESKIVEEQIATNEKYILVKKSKYHHKLEEEHCGVKISIPKTEDKVVLKDTKTNVALTKQNLLDHAQVLVCIH